MYLIIESSFPTEVVLDSLMVSYIPFSLVDSGQHSPMPKHSGSIFGTSSEKIGLETTSSGAVTIGADFFRQHPPRAVSKLNSDAAYTDQFSVSRQSDDDKVGFECRPYFQNDDTAATGFVPNRLVLKPGKQAVPMCFSARTVGEYAPLFISAQIGNLVLVERIDADVNKLQVFFENNTLVSIVTPKKPIDVSILVPSLCPIGAQDSVYAAIGLENNDEVRNLEISLHSVYLPRNLLRSAAEIDNDRDRDSLIAGYIENASETNIYEYERSKTEEASGKSFYDPRAESLARDVHNAMKASPSSLTDIKVLFTI